VLDRAGIDRAHGLIASVSNDKDNLVTTLMARQKNPKLRIITRCIDPRYAERMVKAGANSTVSPNRIGGMRMASEALRPHVVGFLDLMLREHSKTLRIEEIDLPLESPWAGKTLQHLNLRGRYNLLVLATKAGKTHGDGRGHFHPNPPDDHLVEGGSVIIVMGDVQDLRNARHEAHHHSAAAAARS
jgi:voltage-gated potassium channel